MLNLLARMEQHLKEIFSMSINLIRNGEKKKNNQWLSMFFTIQTHKEKEKKSKKLRFAFNK